MFEEFLFAWHDRLRKLEEQTSMSVKLQKEVDRYKVTWVDYSGCLLVLCGNSVAHVGRVTGHLAGLFQYVSKISDSAYFAKPCVKQAQLF